MKKIIIISTSILLIILFILFLLTRLKNQPLDNSKFLPTPTLIKINQQSINKDVIINNLLPFTPYENENFRFDYLPETNQFIVEEKTNDAKKKFIEWSNQNDINDLITNPDLIIFQPPNFTSQPSITNPQSQYFDPIIEFLNIFLNLGQGSSSTTNQQSITNNNQPINNNFLSKTNTNTSLTYYAQCDSQYANLPLPDGCNLCQAGCGPSTVAMIASSYLDKKYDPKNIVNQYKSKGYLLGCGGSRYSDARYVLQSLGLKTTDYLIFNYATADQIINDLKNYLKAGWTFFALANFRENGGGHFFWITDIDDKGNILAYDPYYGRFEPPPINENSRYPFPKYRIAFGVKK